MKTQDKSKQKRRYTRLVYFSSGLVRRRALAFTVAALICCAAVAIAVRAYSTKAPGPGKSPFIAGVPAAATMATTGVLASERVLNESNATPALPQGFVQGRKPTAVAEV